MCDVSRTEESLEIASSTIEESQPKWNFNLGRLVCSASDEFNFYKDSGICLNNFVKDVKFSPDGTCVLASSDDCMLRLYEVSSLSASSTDAASWKCCLAYPEGETIYDISWYTHMSSSLPSSCCFVTAAKDHPLHLWCAYTGTLRASYLGFDHLDELSSPLSVSFNTAGTHLWAGHAGSCLRKWDITRPGKECEMRSTLAKNKCNGKGQRGLLSAISFSPGDSGIFAVGSYSQSLCLYDERWDSRGSGIVGEVRTNGNEIGGITCIRWHPDGTKLYSGSRMNNIVFCWDIRTLKVPLLTYKRQATTNQRIGFDIDPTGCFLATGGLDGSLQVYDTTTGMLVKTLEDFPDSVNSVSFSPTFPLVAVGTGQRHFDIYHDVDTDDEMDSNETRQKTDSIRNFLQLYNFCDAVEPSSGHIEISE